MIVESTEILLEGQLLQKRVEILNNIDFVRMIDEEEFVQSDLKYD